jgi:hypothetical protein
MSDEIDADTRPVSRLRLLLSRLTTPEPERPGTHDCPYPLPSDDARPMPGAMGVAAMRPPSVGGCGSC